MDLFSSPQQLKLLQQLLSPPEDDEPTTTADGRANIGDGQHKQAAIDSRQAVATSTAAAPAPLPVHSAAAAAPRTIAEWEREEERRNDDLLLDQRSRPHYDIRYKQAVCTEDIYLQLGRKTASSASCEEMTIRVQMPDETVSIDHMQLDVTANAIDLRTPRYRLRLPLVHNIDPDKGSARWDTDQRVLTLVLRLQREFDFVNF